MRAILIRSTCFFACLSLWPGATAISSAAATTNVIVWNHAADRVDADVHDMGLWPLLEQITDQTGWRVLVEPGTSLSTSAKFKGLPSSQALQRLLGNLNFAYVPQTNAPDNLYVFRTGLENATRRVFVSKQTPGAKRVPNELIVKLKAGASSDDLAKKYGAKLAGCIEPPHICRFRFDDAAAADAALGQLALDGNVDAVDFNYYLDQPVPINSSGVSALPPQLTLDPPPSSGRIIVGMIDTLPNVSSLGPDVSKFVLTPISVAENPAQPSSDPTHGSAMLDAILQGMASASHGGGSSVQILPVDVYGADATTTTYNVADGIVKAINSGANVINLSLGGSGDSTMLGGIIQSVLNLKDPVFAAAGNTPVTTPFYPAAYPGVIAVTATDGSGQFASYANRGSFISLAAPGTETFWYGGQTYIAQGTSSATATTTGLAAQMLSTGQSLSQVQQTLRQMLRVP